MIELRIGFSLGSLLSIDDILDCAEILQQYVPDSIWIPETWGMDCSSVMTVVSQIARKPKIGSSIINVYSRTPALVAMNAATVDTISHGRLILGLGASSKAIVEEWHGLQFSDPLQRMSEYVDIIRQIISGKKVTYDGKFFHLRNFSLLIKPVRKEIPIYIAAINKRMVELTWSIGDGVIFYLRPPAEMKETISRMQKIRKIDVACQLITCVSDDPEKAITRAKKTISFYVSVGKVYREFLAANGFEKETDAIFEEYKKSGLSETYKFVTDSMADSLSLHGTPRDLPAKLERFARTGIDLPIIQFNPVGNVTESFKLLVSALKEEI